MTIIHGVHRDQAVKQIRHTPSREFYEVTDPDSVALLTSAQLVDLAAGGSARHFGGEVNRTDDGRIIITVSTD